MAAFRSRLSVPTSSITILVASLAFLAGSPARAVWSNDPALNLAIADGPGEQAVPKIAGGSDGSCYVGWYDNASGNYDIRLQRLSPAGIEQWPHNGIVVSSHTQDTWVTDWDLICDSQGNCVLTFSDIRSGNLDVQAYRIAADGQMLWGPDGLNLSQNPAFEPTPTVCEASDGDFVFAWGRFPDAAGGTLQMQRVAPEGALHFPVGGLAVVSAGTEEPGFPDLEPSLGGDVLLMWVRDTAAYTSPRHIRLQRFTPTGSPVWAAFTAIFDASSIPMGYAPEIRSDGAGGAVCGWHRASGNLFGSFVQRVNASGVEAFAHNGVAVSTDATRNHLDPATAYNATTGEFIVFWNERNLDQNQWGIYAQRISSTGVRMWAATGLVLQPVNAIYKSYPRTVPLGDGAVCFVTDTPAGFSGDRLIAYRLNQAGTNVWATVPLPVSTPQSGKSRLPLFIDAAGITRIIWEDTRNGTPDVYGQSVAADGTLGLNPAGVSDYSARPPMAMNYPNPFRGSTQIVWPNGLAAGGFVIAGPDGRVVRRVALPGPQVGSFTWRWDGRDGAGHELPAGVYSYCRFDGHGSGPSGKAILIR
jgi:hypothetical protein